MRKLFFLVLLCTMSLMAEAQSFTNNSNCTVMIRRICYSICNCQQTTPCNTYDVQPGASVLLSVLHNCCGACDKVAYTVCFLTGCPGACVTVSDNTIPACFPASGMAPCGSCFSGPGTLSWVGGNLILQ